MPEASTISCTAVDLADADVLAAMKAIPGYIDISPGDFREVFLIAYAHALQRLKHSLKAGDIMTRPAACIDAETDLIQAALFLANKGYSGAPVTDASGIVLGVLSEKDFLGRMGMDQPVSFMRIVAHCLANKGCMAGSLRRLVAREIMTAPAVTAGPEITVGAISTLFGERQINRLPIVDGQGRPVGIVTRTDLIQALCLNL